MTDNKHQASTKEPSQGDIDAVIIAEAERCNMVAEMCNFVDYDPRVGRVPEHWVPSVYSRAAARAGFEAGMQAERAKIEQIVKSALADSWSGTERFNALEAILISIQSKKIMNE